jgi:hypothetical protein
MLIKLTWSRIASDWKTAMISGGGKCPNKAHTSSSTTLAVRILNLQSSSCLATVKGQMLSYLKTMGFHLMTGINTILSKSDWFPRAVYKRSLRKVVFKCFCKTLDNVRKKCSEIVNGLKLFIWGKLLLVSSYWRIYGRRSFQNFRLMIRLFWW